MKLYTRKQMIQAFNYGKKLEGFDFIENIFDSLTPIELPSDKEIEEFSKIFNRSIDRDAFIVGAHYVLNQIKQKDETN